MKWFEFESTDKQKNVIFSFAIIHRNLEKYPFMSRLSSGSSASCAKINEIAEKIYETLIPHGYDRVSTDALRRGCFSLSDDSAGTAMDYLSTLSEGIEKLPETLFRSPEEKSVCVVPCSREHLEISAVYPSMSVRRALEDAFEIEEKIEAELPYAFDRSLGYLMKSAEDCGCGITLGVMLFLPMCDNYSKSKELSSLASAYLADIRPKFSASSLYILTRSIGNGIDEDEGVQAFSELIGKICALEEGLFKYLLGRERDAELLREQCRCAGFIARSSSLITPKDFFEIYRSLRIGAFILDGEESCMPATEDLDSILYLLTLCSAADGRSDLEFCRALSKKLSETVSRVSLHE